MGLGTTEIIVLGVIFIVLFGAKRLPQMGGSIGKALKNFKDEVTKKDDSSKIDKE